MRKTSSISAITDYLFIGRQPRGPGEYEVLKKLGIELIVNMIAGSPPYPNPPPIKTVHIPAHDDVLRKIRLLDVVRGVDAVFEFFKEGHNIFVHCNAGRHRSVAVGAGILIARDCMTAEQAMRTIKSMRPEADPYAPHVWKVVREFEKYWREKEEERMYDKHN